MAEIRIDPDKFLATLRDALLGSVVKEQQEPGVGVVVTKEVTEQIQPKKKRGRPPKKKFPVDPELAKQVTEEVERFDEPPPPMPRRSSLNPVIRSAPLEVEGKRAKKKKWEPPKGPNRFVDRKLEHIEDTYSQIDPGKKVVYPERSDRRPPVQQVRLRCQKCGREFFDFASAYTNIKEVISVRGEEIYLIYGCECICPA